MEDRSRKFHWKYLISWLILGILGGLAMFISTKTSSLTIVSTVSAIGVMALLSVSFAGLGMLSKAWSAYNWRFGNIEHSPWIWYIYPLAVVVRMVINVWFVVLFRNPFSK